MTQNGYQQAFTGNPGAIAYQKRLYGRSPNSCQICSRRLWGDFGGDRTLTAIYCVCVN